MQLELLSWLWTFIGKCRLGDEAMVCLIDNSKASVVVSYQPSVVDRWSTQVFSFQHSKQREFEVTPLRGRQHCLQPPRAAACLWAIAAGRSEQTTCTSVEAGLSVTLLHLVLHIGLLLINQQPVGDLDIARQLAGPCWGPLAGTSCCKLRLMRTLQSIGLHVLQQS